MSVIITNVTPHIEDFGLNDYVVRINRDTPIAQFQHTRSEGLAECLRRAANAVDAALAEKVPCEDWSET